MSNKKRMVTMILISLMMLSSLLSIFSSSLDVVITTNVGDNGPVSDYQRSIVYTNTTTKNHRIHVAYRNTTSSQIEYMNSTDNGTTWSAIKVIALVNYNPAMAVCPNGTIVMVWAGDEAGTYKHVYVIYSTDQGGSWSSVQEIGDPTYACVSASVSVDYFGNIHVVWYGKMAVFTNFQILYRRYAVGGGWGSITQISYTDSPHFYPYITTKYNYAYVSFMRYTGGGHALYFRFFDGSSWYPVTNISEPIGDPYYESSMVVDSSDNIHCVYRTNSILLLREIKYRSSSDNGATWSGATTLDVGGDNAGIQPTLSITQNDTMYAVWSNYIHVGTRYAIVMRYSTDGGSSWYSTKTLAGKTGISCYTPCSSLSNYSKLPIRGYMLCFVNNTGAGYNVHFYKSYDFLYSIDSILVPTITTNSSTGVLCNNATLWGYVSDFGFDLSTDVRFQYGLTDSYGSETSIQTMASIQTFSANISGLIPGRLYHYRAVGTNLAGTAYGSDMTLLTKPYAPTIVISNDNSTSMIYLTWTKGTGANYTRIQYDTTGYPTTIGDGTNAYNGTGSKVEVSGLSPSNKYYFSLWSFTKWGDISQFSSNYTTTKYLTKPQIPYNIFANWTTSSSINYTWAKGTGANTTYISITPFALPAYWDTGTYFNKTGLTPTYKNYNSFFTSYKTLPGFTTVWSNSVLAPVITTDNVSSVNSTDANLQGYIQKGDNNLKARFRYGYYPTPTTNTSNITLTTTGTFTIKQTGLTPGRLYKYYSYANDSYVNITKGNNRYVLTKPYSPTSVVMDVNFTTKKINISWMNGTGANKTVVVYSLTGIPSTPLDGVMVYNGTHNYTRWISAYTGVPVYYRLWSWTTWTYNPTVSTYSGNGTNMTVGGFYINCFDETTYASLKFNLTISNRTGTQTYIATNVTGPLTINATLLPHGDSCTLYFTVGGYTPRVYTIAIEQGILYLFDAYLPKLVVPGDPGGTYVLQPYSDTVSITSTFWTANKVVPLSKTMDSLIAVEVYNKSISSGYGGWVNVPTAYYTINANNSVTVNHLFLASNTTLARVSYYFRNYGDVVTPLYYLHVVEIITATDYSYAMDVPNCLVTVKRYINTSGVFEVVSSVMTDAGGIIGVYLLPGVFYKVFLNKTGFVESVNDYIPNPPNLYGQTDVKTFSILRNYAIINDTEKRFEVYGFFNGTMYGNNTLKLEFVDTLCNVSNVRFTIYEDFNLTLTYIDFVYSTYCSLTRWFTVNTSRVHWITMSLNQSDFGWINRSITVNPFVNLSDVADRKAWLEDRSKAIFGNFPPGFVNFFVIFGSCLLVLLIPGPKNIEFGIVMVGLVIGLLSTKVTMPWQLIALIPFFMFMGVLYAVIKHGKVKL
jgi:hypothetical protein